MNVSKAIEIAVSEALRTNAELGQSATIRAWQALTRDNSWDPDKDRTFPMVDVRCGPPQTDNNQATCFCECSIVMATMTDDDRGHEQISALYGEVQGVIDSLFSQFRAQSGTVYTAFSAALTDELGATFSLGGLTFGAGLDPADDAGANVIGITLVVHYSRSDY